MPTREEMEEIFKKLMNEGLDLSDKVMTSEKHAVVMAMVCILEDFFQKNKPVELAILKKCVKGINSEVENDKKGTYNA